MDPCALEFETQPDGLRVKLRGTWNIHQPRPAFATLVAALDGKKNRRLTFDATQLGEWDSVLLMFLVRIIDHCRNHGIEVDQSALPANVRGMLDLAYAVGERRGARRGHAGSSQLAQLGEALLGIWQDAHAMTAFTGETLLSLAGLAKGSARFRHSDLWEFVRNCGPDALPIVTLISLLVGMILAFVGAHQLAMFGAQIYIADAVGVGMAREMGAMMTGIIMAGRTGAAFAAQLGTMQVNQEIDAFKTMGFSAMDFLVLPRMIALVLMLPLLCLYADFMGMVGGAVVAISLFDISLLEYVHETRDMLDLADFAIGLVKAGVFGVLVAMAGCLRGMQCGRSSSAVGFAATSAVVTGIVLIIASDALMTILTTALDI